MPVDLTLALVVVATFSSGLLAGASLDQSIKQLPARHSIGSITYSQYMRAADLGNGILFYAILGIGAAIFNIAAAATVHWQGISSNRTIPIYLGALFAVLHSLTTAQAAPTAFSQRKLPTDNEAALEAILNKFARWQSLRCAFQVINFGVNLWALVVYTY
jgi:hypothetical protein